MSVLEKFFILKTTSRKSLIKEIRRIENFEKLVYDRLVSFIDNEIDYTDMRSVVTLIELAMESLIDVKKLTVQDHNKILCKFLIMGKKLLKLVLEHNHKKVENVENLTILHYLRFLIETFKYYYLKKGGEKFNDDFYQYFWDCLANDDCPLVWKSQISFILVYMIKSDYAEKSQEHLLEIFHFFTAKSNEKTKSIINVDKTKFCEKNVSNLYAFLSAILNCFDGDESSDFINEIIQTTLDMCFISDCTNIYEVVQIIRLYHASLKVSSNYMKINLVISIYDFALSKIYPYSIVSSQSKKLVNYCLHVLSKNHASSIKPIFEECLEFKNEKLDLYTLSVIVQFINFPVENIDFSIIASKILTFLNNRDLHSQVANAYTCLAAVDSLKTVDWLNRWMKPIVLIFDDKNNESGKDSDVIEQTIFECILPKMMKNVDNFYEFCENYIFKKSTRLYLKMSMINQKYKLANFKKISQLVHSESPEERIDAVTLIGLSKSNSDCLKNTLTSIEDFTLTNTFAAPGIRIKLKTFYKKYFNLIGPLCKNNVNYQSHISTMLKIIFCKLSILSPYQVQEVDLSLFNYFISSIPINEELLNLIKSRKNKILAFYLSSYESIQLKILKISKKLAIIFMKYNLIFFKIDMAKDVIEKCILSFRPADVKTVNCVLSYISFMNFNKIEKEKCNMQNLLFQYFDSFYKIFHQLEKDTIKIIKENVAIYPIMSAINAFVPYLVYQDDTHALDFSNHKIIYFFQVYLCYLPKMIQLFIPHLSSTNDDHINLDQIVLVSTWRCIQEIANLMKLLYECENKNILKIFHYLQFYETFNQLFQKAKHRGALEVTVTAYSYFLNCIKDVHVYSGSNKLCYREVEPGHDELRCTNSIDIEKFEFVKNPLNLLDSILNDAFCTDENLNLYKCSVKRSAGLPLIIMAILKSVNFRDANLVQVLFNRLINITSEKDGIHLDFKIHAFNIITIVLKSGIHYQFISPYIDEIAIQTLENLKKVPWGVRNASNRCFTAVIARLFGSSTGKMTMRLFVKNHFNLFNYILKTLKLVYKPCTIHENYVDNEIISKNHYMFAILLILECIKSTTLHEICSRETYLTRKCLFTFFKDLSILLTSFVYMIRKKAAKVLAQLISPECVTEINSYLHDMLTSFYIIHADVPNYVHGFLMYINFVFKYHPVDLLILQDVDKCINLYKNHILSYTFQSLMIDIYKNVSNDTSINKIKNYRKSICSTKTFIDSVYKCPVLCLFDVKLSVQNSANIVELIQYQKKTDKYFVNTFVHNLEKISEYYKNDDFDISYICEYYASFFKICDTQQISIEQFIIILKCTFNFFLFSSIFIDLVQILILFISKKNCYDQWDPDICIYLFFIVNNPQFKVDGKLSISCHVLSKYIYHIMNDESFDYAKNNIGYLMSHYNIEISDADYVISKYYFIYKMIIDNSLKNRQTGSTILLQTIAQYLHLDISNTIMKINPETALLMYFYFINLQLNSKKHKTTLSIDLIMDLFNRIVGELPILNGIEFKMNPENGNYEESNAKKTKTVFDNDIPSDYINSIHVLDLINMHFGLLKIPKISTNLSFIIPPKTECKLKYLDVIEKLDIEFIAEEACNFFKKNIDESFLKVYENWYIYAGKGNQYFFYMTETLM
ncbi:hypothetical protein A3Q56_03476 [Intoshia linei]|uniref:Uncharacterized protein n=1 Tax=Intoshia linei TaxID=1819745 RepID=A0A177B3B6_9BILA|nr:hypothetical protein A3Q56_03476 [Intoshia linei]